MTKLTLQNTQILVEINTQGAEILQLRNLIKTQELLWNPDLNYWNRTAPLLFPIVGRLKDDCYFHNGLKYAMKQHGFARDSKFEVISFNNEQVHLRLTSDENTLKQYPFNFQFDVKYTLLQNQLLAENIITNLDLQEMPFSFGAHPGFLIDLPLDDCRIQLHGAVGEKLDKETLKRHLIKDGLYTGDIEEVQLLNGEIVINEEYFESDAIVFKNEGITGMSIFQKGEFLVRLDANSAPYWGIWKKQGAPFICIEPWWGIADPIQTNSNILLKEGIRILEKNENYSIFYSLST